MDQNIFSSPVSDTHRDWSGFVGWAAQQVRRNGNSYTVVSGEIGSYYKNTLKWGTYVNQNYLSKTGWKVYPGDIGYDDGHTWILSLIHILLYFRALYRM